MKVRRRIPALDSFVITASSLGSYRRRLLRDKRCSVLLPTEVHERVVLTVVEMARELELPVEVARRTYHLRDVAREIDQSELGALAGVAREHRAQWNGKKEPLVPVRIARLPGTGDVLGIGPGIPATQLD